MSNDDTLHRFLFEEIGIRGEHVNLLESWQSLVGQHQYPPAVAEQLGKALAAVALLANTVKFNGSLILQTHGNGPLHTLVVQATHEHTVRGLARWHGDIPDQASFKEIFGEGYLVITIQNEGSEPYQGIVGLDGQSIASALENYFAFSEQLATRIYLFADNTQATGLFLQALPETPKDEWQRITILADTVSQNDLLELSVETLLYRLFHTDTIRLFQPNDIVFSCSCSNERISRMLLSLGKNEIEEALQEGSGQIEVTCEFCNRAYHYDSVDLNHLLITQGMTTDPSTTRQ